MSDVDSIWAEMRASAAPANANSASAIKSAAPPPPPRSGVSGKPVIRLRSEASAAAAAASASAAHHTAPASAHAAPRSAEELLPALQREINALSDERVELRRRALQNLHHSLIAAPAAHTTAAADGLGDANAAATDAGAQHCIILQDISSIALIQIDFLDVYSRSLLYRLFLIRRRHPVLSGLAAVLKPALKRFSDPVESCREMAIRLVLQCVPLARSLSVCLTVHESNIARIGAHSW